MDVHGVAVHGVVDTDHQRVLVELILNPRDPGNPSERALVVRMGSRLAIIGGIIGL
jgi:hypothetical protein